MEKIGVHDRTHFEVKLDYSIDSKLRKSRYRVESYFFVPRSLGINRHTYPREQFYSDTQGYIRFKTPNLPLATLADRDDPLSPLHHVRHLLEAIPRAPAEAELQERLGQELRMFGCVARAKLRDRVRAIGARIDVLEGAGDRAVLLGDLQGECRRLLDELDALTEGWRGLRPEAHAEGVPRPLRETFAYVDEYLSLVIEGELTALVSRVDASAALADALAPCRARARARILAERDYRAGAGYPSVVREGADNEHYVYRRGMLKKFVMSVLWLEISREQEGAGVAHLGAGIAAGVAMAFALVATVVHTQWYVLNTAWFIALGTLVYILKDRIKDGLKQSLSSRLRRYLADYSVKIRDPRSGTELGRCRESLSYLDPDAVPASVHALRHKDAAVSIEEMAKPEIVLRYEKDVRLNGAAIIERLPLEDFDLNDIIRFGLAQFFVRADDPISHLATYDPAADAALRRPFPKVYHCNVILVLHANHARTGAVMKRVRVVFDKDGIRRLEQVA